MSSQRAETQTLVRITGERHGKGPAAIRNIGQNYGVRTLSEEDGPLFKTMVRTPVAYVLSNIARRGLALFDCCRAH